MSVKADSKGRLTGAQPGERYIRKDAPDGSITYSPMTPKQYDSRREVSWEQFTEFFGVEPSQVSADGIQLVQHNKTPEGHIPTGFLLTCFVLDEAGKRKYTAEGTVLKTQTLMFIGKQGS